MALAVVAQVDEVSACQGETCGHHGENAPGVVVRVRDMFDRDVRGCEMVHGSFARQIKSEGNQRDADAA